MEIFKLECKEKILRGLLKAYEHVNSIDNEHTLTKLAHETGLNSPYGYMRNFYVKAVCMALSLSRYDVTTF